MKQILHAMFIQCTCKACISHFHHIIPFIRRKLTITHTHPQGYNSILNCTSATLYTLRSDRIGCCLCRNRSERSRLPSNRRRNRRSRRRRGPRRRRIICLRHPHDHPASRAPGLHVLVRLRHLRQRHHPLNVRHNLPARHQAHHLQVFT